MELTIADINRPALVDDDFADLAHYRWRLDKDGYVYRHANRRILLHHVMLPAAPAPGLLRDHRNRDKLDNRLCNLRWLTVAESNANRGPARRNGTGYRGVRYDANRGLFLARIQMGGKALLRRWFDDPAAANDYLVGERKRLMPLSHEAA